MRKTKLNTFLAHAFMLLTTLIYALNYTIAKTIMPHPFDPSGLVFIRVLVASFFFFFIFKIFFYEKINLQDLRLFVVASITGVVINTLLFFEGLSLSKPIDASIIMSLTPVIVYFIAIYKRMENITLLSFIGVFMSFFGLYSLITNFSYQIPAITLGNTLLIINATAYAFYLIYIKKLSDKYKPFTLSFYTFIIALPLVAIFGFNDAVNTNWIEISETEWYALGFVLIFVTILTYLFVTFSSKYLHASIVGFYNYLQPIFAIILALVIGSDSLNIQEGICISIVLLGLWLVNHRDTKKMKNL